MWASAASVCSPSCVVDAAAAYATARADWQVGHPVFESLEAADRAAELDTLGGVLDSELEAACGSTDLLARQEDHRPVEGFGERTLGVLHPQPSGLRAVESDPVQRPARVHRRSVIAVHTG